MAIIRIPSGRPKLSGGQIPLGQAERAGRSAAELGALQMKAGQVQVQEALANARMQQQIGEKILNKAQKEMQAFKDTENQTQYTNAKSNASLEFAQAISGRMQNATDENGNSTHGTLSSDIGQLGKDILGKHSASISDPKYRAQFTNVFSNKIVNQQLRAIGVAQKQQMDFANAASFKESEVLKGEAFTDPGINVNTFIAEKEGSLNARVNRGEITAMAATRELEKFRREVSTTRLHGMISATTDQEDLSNLENQIKTDPGNFGINHKEQQAALQDIRTRRSRLRAETNSQRKQTEAILKPQVKAYEDAIAKGISFDPLIRGQLADEVKGTSLERPFKITQIIEDEMGEFSQLSGPDRERVLSDLRKQDHTGASLEILDKFEKANQRISESIEADPESFAIEQGIIRDSAPLDLSNAETLVGQLAERRARIDSVESRYDVEADGLTDPELSEMTTMLNRASPEEQSNLYSAILAGYGDKAMSVFKSLEEKGLKHGAAIGLLNIQGNPKGARLISEGNHLIKNESIVLPTPRAFAVARTDEHMVPGLSTNQEKEKMDAAMSVYASLAHKAGKFDGKLDKELLNEAYDVINNGGLMEIDLPGLNTGDYTIEPPNASINTEEKWVEYISNITPEEIEAMGGLRGIDMTEQDVRTALTTGAFASRGPGRYNLFNSDGVPYVTNDGQLFELDYGELEDIRNGTHTEARDLEDPEGAGDLSERVQAAGDVADEELSTPVTTPEPLSQAPTQEHPTLISLSTKQEQKPIVNRVGELRHGGPRPTNSVREIILHHTGGGSSSGAIETLKKRGLSYHYIIEKDGTVIEMVSPKDKAFHARGHNNGTIGISYVGGGPGGEITEEAVRASSELIKDLKGDYPSLQTIAGHKHRSTHGKPDPEGVDIQGIADYSGLRFND